MTELTGYNAKVDQVRIVKTIGERFKLARELNGLTQLNAAKKLGYKNSSKLSKVENGNDTLSVPLWLIHKASEVYDVSIGYFFGETDDWEIDPIVKQERQVGKWVFEELERIRVSEINVFRVMCSKLVFLSKSVSRTNNRSKGNFQALIKLIGKNSEAFYELEGSKKFLHMMQETAEEAAGIRKQLDRLELEVKTRDSVEAFEGGETK